MAIQATITSTFAGVSLPVDVGGLVGGEGVAAAAGFTVCKTLIKKLFAGPTLALVPRDPFGRAARKVL